MSMIATRNTRLVPWLRRGAVALALAWGVVVAGETMFLGASSPAWVARAPGAQLAGMAAVLLGVATLRLALSRGAAWSVVALATWTLAFAGAVKQAKLGAPVLPVDLRLLGQAWTTAQMLWGWRP